MYVSQRSPKFISVAKAKTRKPVQPASAMAASEQDLPGTHQIAANRAAWADALDRMSGVRTPDPLTAFAKIAGMGLAGYGQGKAARDRDALDERKRKLLAQSLTGESEDAQPMSPLSQNFGEMPMQVPQMPPEDTTPLPGEETDNDPYSDDINRSIADWENQYQGRMMPLLGQRVGPQDHSILDHRLDGTEQDVIDNRPIPGTDAYYEMMTGQPYDMSPAGPPVPMPRPRPDDLQGGMPQGEDAAPEGGFSPMSYSPAGAAPAAMRRAPGRFGGSIPDFAQPAGFQRTAADGEDPAQKPEKAKKLTESQSKDVNFYNRGIYANEELSSLETALQQPIDAAASNLPFIGGVVGPFITDADYKRADRAAREFLAIVLRKDTGAQVTNQELAMYGPMYIPAYNDDDSNLAAKREARQRFLDGLYYGSGEARSVFDEIRSGFDTYKNSRKRDALKSKYGLED